MPDSRAVLPALLDSADDLRAPGGPTTSVRTSRDADLFGMATFWSVVLTAAMATLLLYCWPAADRIDRQSQALQTARQRLADVRERNEKLTAEARALDDPFYIERVLRFEFNWRPAPRRTRGQ